MWRGSQSDQFLQNMPIRGIYAIGGLDNGCRVNATRTRDERSGLDEYDGKSGLHGTSGTNGSRARI